MSNSNVQIPAPTTTFRDLITYSPPNGIAPTFMLGPVFSRYNYSWAIMYDALIDNTGYAVRARFPLYAPPDAMTWLGQDRQVVRGPNEPQASYVQRLIQWLDLWRHAGSSTAVMLATLAYLYPLQPQISTVCWSSPNFNPTWDTYLAQSNPFSAGQTNPTPPYHRSQAAKAWHWDDVALPFYAPWMWWRKWLIIQSNGSQAPWSAPTAVWASGGNAAARLVADAVYGQTIQCTAPATPGANTCDWGDGTCWGWSGTSDEGAALTAIVTDWKSAGCWYPWILVTYDPTYFQVTNTTEGVGCPDGRWGLAHIVSDPTYASKLVTTRPSCATATFIVGSSDGGGVLGLG
jgi:hypothetical protein